MTSKLKIALAAAIGFAVASFGSVALAEDTVSAPDAMSSNHMSSDHMGGTTKKHDAMKHDAMKQMTNEGAMSTDHMAPNAGKQ